MKSKNLFRFHSSFKIIRSQIKLKHYFLKKLFFSLIMLNKNFISAAINQHTNMQGNVKMANASFIIQPFEKKYQSEVIDLIERIQVEEFNIPIEEAQRKELQSISHSFQKNKGNYWVALLDGNVIGTIAVIDIGHRSFELRDVFLDKKYRGQSTEFAKKLLSKVFDWAKEHEIDTIYLGTTLAFKAAHRFYEKHGFREISREDMPSYCQPMDCDEKFYCLDLK